MTGVQTCALPIYNKVKEIERCVDRYTVSKVSEKTVGSPKASTDKNKTKNKPKKNVEKRKEKKKEEKKKDDIKKVEKKNVEEKKKRSVKAKISKDEGPVGEIVFNEDDFKPADTDVFQRDLRWRMKKKKIGRASCRERVSSPV